MPLLLVRHAWAGHAQEWVGDDAERPLDERGTRQAQELVACLLELPVDEILTSPYRRCVQTVLPLAAARSLEPAVRSELGEARQSTAGLALVREFAERDVVVCGHGGLERALVDPPEWRKGMTFVVEPSLRVVDVLEV